MRIDDGHVGLEDRLRHARRASPGGYRAACCGGSGPRWRGNALRPQGPGCVVVGGVVDHARCGRDGVVHALDAQHRRVLRQRRPAGRGSCRARRTDALHCRGCRPPSSPSGAARRLRPSSSPMTASPGFTTTPPQAIGTFTSPQPHEVVPDRGVMPRAMTGRPSSRNSLMSRTAPSTIRPRTPRCDHVHRDDAAEDGARDVAMRVGDDDVAGLRRVDRRAQQHPVAGRQIHRDRRGRRSPASGCRAGGSPPSTVPAPRATSEMSQGPAAASRAISSGAGRSMRRKIAQAERARRELAQRFLQACTIVRCRAYFAAGPLRATRVSSSISAAMRWRNCSAPKATASKPCACTVQQVRLRHDRRGLALQPVDDRAGVAFGASRPNQKLVA